MQRTIEPYQTTLDTEKRGAQCISEWKLTKRIGELRLIPQERSLVAKGPAFLSTFRKESQIHLNSKSNLDKMVDGVLKIWMNLCHLGFLYLL